MKNPNRFYVYLFIDPRTGVPFYAGKGHGDRVKNHFRPSYLKRKSHFYCKLRGMLSEGVDPRVVILRSSLAEEDAILLEIATISRYGRRDLGTGCLCNLTDGGDGLRSPSEETRAKMAVNTGKSLPQETRDKMSASRMGRQTSAATRVKLSEALSGREITDEWRAKIGAANRGKVRTQEFRERVSQFHIGRSRPDADRKTMSDAQRRVKGRRVQSMNPVTGEIKTYEIMSDVAKDGYSQGNVSACCNGTRSSHKGLTWSYCAEPTGQ